MSWLFTLSLTDHDQCLSGVLNVQSRSAENFMSRRSCEFAYIRRDFGDFDRFDCLGPLVVALASPSPSIIQQSTSTPPKFTDRAGLFDLDIHLGVSSDRAQLWFCTLPPGVFELELAFSRDGQKSGYIIIGTRKKMHYL